MPENHVTEGQFVEYIQEAATQMNKIDDKINQVEKITGFNQKGNVATYADLATIENPQVNDAYGVIADGLTYVYNGTSFPTEGNGMDLRIKPDGVIEDGNTQAVSGGEVYNYNIDDNEYAHVFTDKRNLLLGFFDQKGEFYAVPTKEFKEENLFIDKINVDFYGITNENNVIIKGVNSNNEDVYQKKINSNQKIIITSPKVIKDKLILETIAKGRGVDVPLVNSGMTHPKVLYIKNGWNGFKYWMAITPTFGPISLQTDPASYENPTIFCSNDGINWYQPSGIINPIDLPSTAPSYWSDTDLILGNDGYLYCIYRGNFMPASYVGKTGDAIRRVVVYKKSKDGVNWGGRQYMYSTSDENYGIDAESGIMSPSFFYNGNLINVYDVVKNTTLNPYVGQNQTNYIVHRRSGFDLKNINGYSQDTVVNFTNRPYGSNYDIWHIDAVKAKGIYFMTMACGLLNSDYADKLYLSYSYDGWNFTTFEQPISRIKSYRASIVEQHTDNENEISFLIYNPESVIGYVELMELKIILNN